MILCLFCFVFRCLHIFNEPDFWVCVCCCASFRFTSNRQDLIHKSMELLNKVVFVQSGMLCWQSCTQSVSHALSQSVSRLHLIRVTHYSWYLGQSTQYIRNRHRTLDETNETHQKGWISGPGPWKMHNCSAAH